MSPDPATSLTTVVRSGIALVSLMSVAVGAYAWLTWGQPHRGVLVAAAVIGVVEAVVLLCAGARSMLRSGDPDTLLAAWSAAHIALAAALCCFDSGVSSPLGTLVILWLTFSAVALPPRHTAAVAATAILALAAVAVLGPRPETWAGFYVLRAPGLIVAAGVCATIASERRRRIASLRDSQEEIPRRLARVIEFRDRDTGGHVERMSEIAGLIARQVGFDAPSARRLQQASVMHDIGKVAISDAILLKAGPLDPEERREMQRHARRGFEMLTGSSSELLELGATIALSHHERFDGDGYPDGLRGDDIPIAARITAVADVFDALISDRVYKAAMSTDEAVLTILQDRGHHFDPAVADAFVRALPEILALQDAAVRGAAAHVVH